MLIIAFHSHKLPHLLNVIWAAFNQSCVQIKASTVNGDNELLNESNIRPPLLKANSDATVEIEIANTSRATYVRI